MSSFKPGQLVKFIGKDLRTIDAFESEISIPGPNCATITVSKSDIFLYVKNFLWEGRMFAVVLIGDRLYEIVEKNLNVL